MKTLEQRFWEKVHKSADCWHWTGGKIPGGYGHFRVGNRQMKAHRVAHELLIGPIQDGMFIDHICHNRGCVNPKHLRMATRKQNQENLRGAQANSATGVRGVSWHSAGGKWRVGVQHDGKVIHVGYFNSIKEAEDAAIAKRNELFTHNDLDRKSPCISQHSPATSPATLTCSRR